MRHRRSTAAALLGGLVIATLASGAVLGHAELLSSTPAANASLLESPPKVTMTFSEPIDPATASVQLLDPLRQEISGLGPVQVDATGTVASVAVPTLDPGIYTVSYRVTSATDGHVGAGTWAFLIDPTGSEPPPAVGPQSSSESGDPLTIAARWLALAPTLVVLGLALFWLVSARPALAATGGNLRAPWLGIAVGAGLALGGLWAYLTLLARPFADAGAAGGIPLDLAAAFGATPFAGAMRLTEGGLVAAFLVAAARLAWPSETAGRAPMDGERTALWLVAAAAGMALAGASLAGHAASGGPIFATIDWLHLLAVAAWVGTLPGLLLLALRPEAQASDRGALIGSALRRHSRLALAAAPLVALTGLANSPLVLGGARGLVATGYGNVLLAKVVLFSIAVAIGAANFFLVRATAFRRAVPLIAVELVVGAMAVLAASSLVTTEPAADQTAVLTNSAIGTLHLYGEAGASTVHAAIILPAPGEQRYQVSVTDTVTHAYRTDVQRVILVFGPPKESDLPDERADLEPGTAPWLWSTRGAYTPTVGDWSLEVVVRRLGEPDESATFDLPVTEPLPPAVVPPPDTGIGVPLPLAWLWLALPRGAAGWLVPVTLLAAFAGVSMIRRRTWDAASSQASLARVTLALMIVVSGVGIGSRAIAEVANETPDGAARAINPVTATASSVSTGNDLYLANCAACHGTTGAGDGLTAAGMVPGPGDLSTIVPALTDGELAYLIASGTVATRMPAFSITLSEHDRWDLVNYLRATWP
jgi:copper transport protein